MEAQVIYHSKRFLVESQSYKIYDYFESHAFTSTESASVEN